MAYLEDLKGIFGEREGGFLHSEVSLYGSSALVISGHRGLSFLSQEEIVVRRKKGSIRVVGRALRVEKAGPDELYVTGDIRSVEFVDPSEVTE